MFKIFQLGVKVTTSPGAPPDGCQCTCPCACTEQPMNKRIYSVKKNPWLKSKTQWHYLCRTAGTLSYQKLSLPVYFQPVSSPLRKVPDIWWNGLGWWAVLVSLGENSTNISTVNSSPPFKWEMWVFRYSTMNSAAKQPGSPKSVVLRQNAKDFHCLLSWILPCNVAGIVSLQFASCKLHLLFWIPCYVLRCICHHKNSTMLIVMSFSASVIT